MRLGWLESAYSHPLFTGSFAHKVGHTDLVSGVCYHGSLVGMCTQHYKCLCALIMICGNLVDPKCVFYLLTCGLEK